MHEISEAVWMDYLDETIDVKEKLRVDNHLTVCEECQDFYQRMVKTENTLKAAGVEITNSFQISQESVSVNLAKVLARILDADAQKQNLSRNEVEERLNELTTILATMCGSWTAVNALRVAAEGTIAKTPGRLTRETWIPFLERLKKISAVFCGDVGAKLVWEYGQL
jgi:anti-sigma factor RsiW